MAVMVGSAVDPESEGSVADPADLPWPDPDEPLAGADAAPAAVLLAGEPGELPGQWVDAGASAWFAETNRAAWQQARWTLEASRARADVTDRATDRPRAAKIVAASLGWSEGYAEQRLEFARQALERLPALGDAMADGRLEEHKASIFTTTLADLDTDQARTVVERVLPAAPRLAFRALRDRIEKEAEAVDPDWAAARRAAAIARRRVSFRIAPSGAAELCGLDLPEEPAQDAHDRIVALGRVVARRLRRAGLDAPKGPIESEVMLTLMGPDGVGMWDGDVVEHVVTRFGGPPDDEPDSDPDPRDGPDDGGPDDGGPDDGGPHDGDPGDDGGPDGAEPDNPDRSQGGPHDDDSGSGRTDADVAPSAGDPEDGAHWRVPFTPRVALRVGLKTLLGLDRRPGEIPGCGPVVNSVAVSMAWSRTRSSWRLLLYDPDGALAHVGTVRPPRTGGPSPHADQRRDHVVEVTATVAELDALVAALRPGVHSTEAPDDEVPEALRRASAGIALIRGDALGLLERAGRALAVARDRPIEEHPAHTVAEAGNRFPSAALRAWVQARDRTCRAPGCAADAVGCDIDHTVPVTQDGRTVASDLGPFCRSDHVFKHDPDAGWTVEQPSAGRFVWTAPTGRVHVVEPEPYDPLPDPVPRADGSPVSLPGSLSDPPPPVHPPGSPRRTADPDHARPDEQEPELDVPPDHYPEEPPF